MSEENTNKTIDDRPCNAEERKIWESIIDNQSKELEELSHAEAVRLGMVIDFENLKPNSVFVIKLSSKSPEYYYQLQRAIVDLILAPRQDLLKSKNIGILFMSSDDSVELLSEEDMAKAGWVRDNKKV